MNWYILAIHPLIFTELKGTKFGFDFRTQSALSRLRLETIEQCVWSLKRTRRAPMAGLYSPKIWYSSIPQLWKMGKFVARFLKKTVGCYIHWFVLDWYNNCLMSTEPEWRTDDDDDDDDDGAVNVWVHVNRVDVEVDNKHEECRRVASLSVTSIFKNSNKLTLKQFLVN